MKFAFGITMAAVALAGLMGFATPSFAKNYVVKELNYGPNGNPDEFSPDFLQIEPGDKVTFEDTDQGHDAVSLKGDIPVGAKPFKVPMTKTASVTFTVPGVYAYKCQPHLSFGMVGVIIVGHPATLNKLSFAGLPRRAHDRLVALAARADKVETVSR